MTSGHRPSTASSPADRAADDGSSVGSAFDRPRVVLTRAAEHNHALAQRLATIGVDAVDIPMIEVQPPADGGRALEASIAGLDLYHWLVVTSANGAVAVADMMKRVGVSRPDHLKVAVVGPATADAANALGWPVDFQPTSATAKDLAAEFPPSGDGDGPQRVLAALAELGAATVRKGLTEKGYRVDHIVAYRTAAPGPDPDPVREAEIVAAVRAADAVTFTSPSTVTRFIDRFGVELVPPLVAVIGPRTAKRCRYLDLDVSIVADPHTEDGLVAAIEHLLVAEP